MTNRLMIRSSLFVILVSLVGMTTGCGIVNYPGQPGMVTNNFNKLDFEYLDEPGLFVYETTYDNRAGGSGVGAVVTKLYPGARTYTSNVRTNADGTLYRSKVEYDGAQIQMISVPNLGQVHLSPNHQLVFFVDYETSLDETDDKNLSEAGLFKQTSLSPEINIKAFQNKKMKWDLIRAGTLNPSGGLSYEVTGVEMKGIKFNPSQSVHIETNFLGTSVRTQLTGPVRSELVQFIETNFPKGFKGEVNLHLKGVAEPLTISLGINTVKTLEASGVKLLKDASASMLEEILARFKGNQKEGDSK